MADGDDRIIWLAEVRDAVRRADPRAFLVPARIVRRAIKQSREGPGAAGFRVPHRKSFVISGANLRYLVDKDELGLTYAEDIPSYVFLLSEPKESELEGMSATDMRRWAWRLLFHARIHYEIERQLREEELTPSDIRALIDRIGQVEFDEAESVLQREHFLPSRVDRVDVFVEFAAVYWEYRCFSPQRIPWYFPSMDDPDETDSILACGLDMGQLLAESRPELPAGVDTKTDEEPQAEPEQENSQATIPVGHLNQRRAGRLMAAAEKSAVRGNTARVAILCARAAGCSSGTLREEALRRIDAELVALTDRLQAALKFDDEEAIQWREILHSIVCTSLEGFWNADKRLLYDLQKVCVDHEKDVYRIDLLEWVRTLGKRPIKRPLPFQQEVLSVKHLRNAIQRLNATGIPEQHREKLARLLHEAVETAQERLRETLRPVVREALTEVRFSPANPAETVAFKKLIEEILDEVIKRGYVNMGVLRDAISRNRIKLEDLADAKEFFKGDQLLQADRSMAKNLDGVYRRGEFYLRWLQRLSSVAFGTRSGRLLTLWALIPFGGAFIVLNFFAHLFEKLGFHSHRLMTWQAIGGGGLFLLAMIHSEQFRYFVKRYTTLFMRVVSGILVDVPFWAIRNKRLRRILRSRPMVMFRRYIFVPGIFTLMFCLVLPQFGVYDRPPTVWIVVIFLLLMAALNSRVSRDMEEMTADYLEHTWWQIRTRIFVAFFEAIMGAFKAMLEFVERVLYAVDEWSRFRSGESQVTFGIKAVFGVFWAAVAFVMTFAITLLIEPQINPIKHFPVVTVSHKIILPMEPMLQAQLTGALDEATAHFVAVMIVTAVPGGVRISGLGTAIELATVCSEPAVEAETGDRGRPRRDDDPAAQTGVSFRDVTETVWENPSRDPQGDADGAFADRQRGIRGDPSRGGHAGDFVDPPEIRRSFASRAGIGPALPGTGVYRGPRNDVRHAGGNAAGFAGRAGVEQFATRYFARRICRCSDDDRLPGAIGPAGVGDHCRGLVGTTRCEKAGARGIGAGRNLPLERGRPGPRADAGLPRRVPQSLRRRRTKPDRLAGQVLRSRREVRPRPAAESVAVTPIGGEGLRPEADPR